MKKQNNQVLAQVRMANGAIVDIYDIGLAQQMGLIPTQASVQETTTSAKQKKGKGGNKAQPKVEEKVKDTPFTKHDGTVVMTTKAQADAWTKHRDGYTDRVASKEANLAKFEADRKAYKPSQALIKAIKADRASITLAVAKAQYGFVGTKPDLKALKDKVCK